MDFSITLLSCVVFLLCFLEYLLFYTPKARIFNKIPGSHKYPIVGDLFSLLKLDEVELFEMPRRMAKRFGKIYNIQVFNYRLVNVLNPEDVEIVLSNPKCATKSLGYKFMQPWLKDGLLTILNGPKHHQRRKILTPAFHFNTQRQFCRNCEEKSMQMVELLKSRTGEATDVLPILTKFVLNIICETAVGKGIDDSSFKKYSAAVHKMSEVVVHRMIHVWMHNDFVFMLTPTYWKQRKTLSVLHGLTTTLIRQRRIELQNGHKEDTLEGDDASTKTSKNKMVALDLLLSAEAEGKIDELGIREEIDAYLFAGHDTSTSVLRFSLMALANNKEAQGKIVKELDEIFEGSHREATMEDFNKMNYLGMCIKECLRLYPPGAMISRLVTGDVQLTDYLVPSGAMCLIHTFDLHRNPSVYPSPDEFIPERFTPENCAKRHPFAYIPFSAGTRNCIGQKLAMLEMKSMLSRIFRNFVLEPITKPEDITFKADLTLQSKDPVYVKFKSRN